MNVILDGEKILYKWKFCIGDNYSEHVVRIGFSGGAS